MLRRSTLLVSILCVTAAAQDPLPSWNDTQAKRKILEFVSRTSTENGPGYVAAKDRIATFDNDGTLWAEQPVVEGLFVAQKLKEYVARHPEVRNKQPYKALIERDREYLVSLGEEAALKMILQVLTTIYANESREDFQADARKFYETAIYPKPNGPIKGVAYQPMLELLTYLRANGFQTWLCSGGTIDFMRAFSEDLYGIPPQQVIGTRFKQDYRELNGRLAIWREQKIESINDKAEKPVNIALQIGKRPIFAAGNERSGGDIGQLTYSAGREGPSFQLLINHDDADREFAYQEPDNASLKAAKAGNWTVASMKNDWNRIFPSQ